ncbi:MAG: sortase B protein-sorting domain-containing protein, partial [Massilioclostridium sp.]|nr:sortase B protein-sorting domain-containing protein [Massilioclostridium sp.]
QAGDKKQLELLLFEADKIDLSKYVEAGQAEFTAAVEKAENCYNDADALQGDVEEAVEALLNAMLNLRFKADKSLLTQLTEAAQQIDLSAYTSESVERFEAALAHAKATLDNEALSQDDQAVVDRAFDDLQKAIEGLAQADGTSSLAVNGDGTLSTATNSAKTGDTAPIALASALLLAGAAVVLCKKRGTEQ